MSHSTPADSAQSITNLAAHHLRMLKEESGIAEAVIIERGARTVTEEKELAALGFAPAQRQVPGLLLPLHSTDSQTPFYVFRPDNPRVQVDKRQREKDGQHPNKVIKYETPKGAAIRVDCPPRCRPQLADPAITLWITEGQKKADSLATQSACAIALLGVWNFKGKNDFGGVTLLADFDYIALNGRLVRIVFDSDVMHKPEVQKALERLKNHLERKGAHVQAVYLRPAKAGAKIGVDDYLASGHTLADLEALAEGPRPAPQPAAPLVRLLDAAPAAIRRPLCLVEGHAYAATWLHVELTITQERDKDGGIVYFNPPKKMTRKELYVMRDDGRVFGLGGDEPLEALGLEVYLPEEPATDKIWSKRGLLAYRENIRPNPAEVFRRLVSVVNRFMDFDSSLAEQNILGEMLACYILATWFLDAFKVIGYVWPNGDKGSGKTKLLALVAQLAYLGVHVQGAGSSFAPLRDLADYGATICFDDCEDFANHKDDEKRQFLLAGNRKGNSVLMKEQQANGTWKTRHVNSFCAKLFSATQLPDSVLESRTIVIPLVKSPDENKSNADILDFAL